MNSYRAAIIIGIIGILILIFGYFHLFGISLDYAISELYTNFGTDFISIAITVLVIDNLNKRRQEDELKRQLIREMGSENNVMALRAIREMKACGKNKGGWTTDGSLNNAPLMGANLSNASLEGASLIGADLTYTKLNSAFLTDAKLNNTLLEFSDLSDADLEDANLQGAKLRGTLLINTNLSGADLRNSNLGEARLQGIKYNISTLWPDKFEPPKQF